MGLTLLVGDDHVNRLRPTEKQPPLALTVALTWRRRN
jgi:hypothetical protein